MADCFGHRTSLFLGSLRIPIALASFGFGTAFPHFIAVYILWALGQTLRSGADDALLYDTLVALGQEAEYTRIAGRTRALYLVTTAITSAVGGLLAESSLVYPFWATAVVVGLSALVVLTMQEPPRTQALPNYAQVLRESGILLQREREVRRLILYLATVFALLLTTELFAQPVLRRAGLSLTGIGLFYTTATGIAAGASAGAWWLEERLGFRRVMLGMPLLSGGAMLTAGLWAAAAVPGFLALRSAASVLRPVGQGALNRLLPSATRATLLSVTSMTQALVGTPLRLMMGALADQAGIGTALGVLGLLAVATSGLAVLLTDFS